MPEPVFCGPLFGKRICEHLGLDPNEVHSIDIHIEIEHVAKAVVEDHAGVRVEHLILHPDETEPIEHVFEDYALVDKARMEAIAQDQVALGMQKVLDHLRSHDIRP